MKRRNLLIFLALLPLCARSQAPQDPLQALQARLATFDTVRAEFTQRKDIAAMKRPLLSNGRVLVSREHGVLWQLEQPLNMGYVLQADRIVEIAPDGTRRLRSAQDQPGLGQVARVFRALLNAQNEALAEYFDLRPLPAAQGWAIELKPRQPQLAQYLQSIRLSGKDFVESIRIDEASGDRSLIEFQNSRGGGKLEPAEAQLFGSP